LSERSGLAQGLGMWKNSICFACSGIIIIISLYALCLWHIMNYDYYKKKNILPKMCSDLFAFTLL
jgi:hypothetical protein